MLDCIQQFCFIEITHVFIYARMSFFYCCFDGETFLSCVLLFACEWKSSGGFLVVEHLWKKRYNEVPSIWVYVQMMIEGEGYSLIFIACLCWSCLNLYITGHLKTRVIMSFGLCWQHGFTLRMYLARERETMGLTVVQCRIVYIKSLFTNFPRI